ncbi:hypothetical protein CERZMDRAFT_108112 [Cercospora zeae-maydis SCOH1-5]|uniref:Uncharacterized protein n=1 Tax=Cercospora zeae-maydis SCOH1-5 TaxID=717836 RepID=A0A6A6EZ14_9PEZI|nr:hypothetical protein CERZMDRAFT_108112 [Cercospora zeae-maydis SCOH1-5]
MDFSTIPRPAKKQKKRKSRPVATVAEVRDEDDGFHHRRQSDIRKSFMKWFKRQHKSHTTPYVNNSHFFEQARAYEVVEPLVPLLVAEKRPESYPQPVFGGPL